MLRPINPCRLSSALAVAAFAGFATHAVHAASVTVSTPYDFTLSDPDDNDVYEGSTTVSLDQFDDQGGTLTLEEAKLTLEMTLAGEIFVYEEFQNPTAASSFSLFDGDYNPYYGGQVHAEFEGSATAGPLTADASFADYDGQPVNDYVTLDLFGSGSDSATTGLGDLIGQGEVDVDLQALIRVMYEQFGLAGNAGASQGLSATGDVSLEYTYTTAFTGVPTPAAAGMGLTILAGLCALRRRRAV